MNEALYVHIPFCNSICDYCDFTKLQYFHYFVTPYINALKKELLEVVTNKNLKTIYIGGGTPSSLTVNELKEILEALKPYTKYVEEYTIEANPESLSMEKIKLLKEYGINRVSIGVESTNDEILKSINRKHSFKDVINVDKLLKANDITNINYDLILGLPNVNKTMFKTDLENLLSLNPNHLSIYSLTVHLNTVFYINGINEPNDEYARDLYDLSEEILKDKGYIHYEVSNFSKPGFESKHNFTYWNNKEYFAIGLGASAYTNDIRYRNTKNINKYINNDYDREIELVSLKDKKTYMIMLNLRTIHGLDLNEYKSLFNEDLYFDKRIEIDSFINKGLLIKQNNKLIPTYEGMMVLDHILLKLF